MRREFFVIILGILVTVGVLVGVGYTLSHRQAAQAATESIDVADSLAAEGDWSAVIDTLQPLAEKPPSPDLAERIWILLAQANAELGNAEESSALWQRVAEDGTTLQLRGEALCHLAEEEIAAGNMEEAEAHMATIDQLGVPNVGDRVALIEAKMLLANGDDDGARERLIRAVARFEDSDHLGEMEDMLSELNLDRLFSRQPHDDDILYEIQSGDTLDGLGRDNGVSPTLLQHVNNIDPRRLRVGHRIKIPINEFSIQVYKEDFYLYVFDHGEFFARYPCRVGREEYMTPLGEFTIQQRTVNPEWTTPEGRRVGAGDPENELGTRWMGFREAPTIGIHGTIHPDSIGTNASSGCIGLVTEDVEQLYDLIPRGTTVQIFSNRVEAQREESSSE